jgi:hypothetical protein
MGNSGRASARQIYAAAGKLGHAGRSVGYGAWQTDDRQRALVGQLFGVVMAMSLAA